MMERIRYNIWEGALHLSIMQVFSLNISFFFSIYIISDMDFILFEDPCDDTNADSQSEW